MRNTAIDLSEGSVTLTLAEVEALCRDGLMRAGMTRHTAEAMARHVGRSEAWGCRSGGLAPMPDAIELLRTGRAFGDALPGPLGPAGALTEIDGRHGLLAPGLDLGLAELIAASKSGLAHLKLRRVADHGSVVPVALRIAEMGRTALVKGPSGQIAAARPGMTSMPDLLRENGPTARSLALWLRHWTPAPDPTTGPLGGPVDGCLVCLALPPDQLQIALPETAYPVERRERVSVPETLLARLINA